MQHTLSTLPPPRCHSVQQCSTHDAKVDDIVMSEPECLHNRVAQVQILVHDAIQNLLAAIRDKFTKASRRNPRGHDIGVPKNKVISDPPAHHFTLLACQARAPDQIESQLLTHRPWGTRNNLGRRLWHGERITFL
jgi:hypothetical protein